MFLSSVFSGGNVLFVFAIIHRKLANALATEVIMAIDFPEQIFGFNVEKRVIPRPGGQNFLFNSHTQIGVLHTTENPSVESSFNTLNKNHSAPHFIVGEGRIIQCRSLTHQAAALVGNAPFFANAQASIQIEMAAFTGGGKDTSTTTDVWLPKDEVLRPTIRSEERRVG